MAFSLKYFFRGPSVSEERDWERENIREKTERYLRTNPLDRFEQDVSYRSKVELVENHLQGVQGLVLDLGGNTAGEATILQQHGFAMVVADINEYALDVSRQRVEKFGLRSPHFVALDAHRLPFRDGVFAAVTVLEALHHFFDYDKALGEIHRVLAPGGRLISIEPNALNPLRRASEVRDRLRGTIEKSFYAGDLVKLCRRAGFVSAEVVPFPTLRSSWKLEEVPAYRRPVTKFHGWLCVNFPTIFAAHALTARKAGEPVAASLPPLAEILCSPLNGQPLRQSDGGWIDDEARVKFPDVNGIPVLIAGEERPVKE
jgi:ubiquinone/menaquinone biosynthesis C-methylase UbiE